MIAKKQREENLCPHCGHRTRDSGCIEKLCKLCCAEWDNGCKVKSHIKAKDEDEEDEEEERQKECTECGGYPFSRQKIHFLEHPMWDALKIYVKIVVEKILK